MHKPTDIGPNRTGIATSPIDSKRTMQGAAQAGAVGADGHALELERVRWSADAFPLGTIPPPGTVKGVIKTELKSGPINMLGAFIAQGALKSISQRMNPSRYNGASLLGLRGLVFKSHGGEDAYGFEWAIKRAFEAARHDVLARISTTIAELMPSSDAATSSPSPASELTQQKMA